MDLQGAVAAEFLALADLLESHPEARWDTPSLCDGWRVREDAAHMTMAAGYSPAQFYAELSDVGGDFTRHSDGSLPRRTLVQHNMREEAMHHWTPPGGGHAGSLNPIVIHGLDITTPLGVARRSSDAATLAVLDDLTAGGTHAHFGFDLTGLALRATDIDWTFGSGAALSGASEDLALLRAQAPAGADPQRVIGRVTIRSRSRLAFGTVLVERFCDLRSPTMACACRQMRPPMAERRHTPIPR